MALLDNILSYHRVISGVHEDQDSTPLADGVNFGSPSTSTGDGGEEFVNYNGSSQYSHLPFASSDLSSVTRTFAFRCKTAVTPSSLNFLACLCSTTDNDPFFAADGTGADSVNVRSRGDAAGSGTNISTGTSAGLWDGTERIIVVSITGGVQSIKELTTGINASVTSGLSTTTTDRLGLAAFTRTSSPVWYSDIDISWVAVWDKVLTAQDETDLAASPWPFSVAPTRSITSIDGDNDVQAGQTGVIITAEGLDNPSTIQTVTLGGETLTVTGWA